uniref:HCV F-transactivated protein 1 n=1 Tax=Sciurus vulgaris TaxID=55149 RepID=A0A8D2D2W2_SCIVU
AVTEAGGGGGGGGRPGRRGGALWCDPARPWAARPGAPQAGTNGLPKHSYWLDLWLFVLFDVVLFLFVYLLP